MIPTAFLLEMGIAAARTWGIILFLVGIGLVVRRLLGFRVRDANGLLFSFWIGYAALIGDLQIWNLFFPVNSVFAAIFLAVAVCGFAWNRKDLRNMTSCRASVLIPVGILLMLTLWVANRAMSPIFHYDTGLYHFANTRWLCEYPIVPGLANLHGRFGYNCSYFLYTALLSAVVGIREVHPIANSPFVVVLFAEALVGMRRVLSRRQPAGLHDLFRSTLLAPALVLCMGVDVPSLSPDFLVFAFGAVLIGWAVRWITLDGGKTERRSEALCAILLLAGVGITTKVNFVVPGMTVVLFVAVCVACSREWPQRAAQWIAAGLFLLLCGTWVLRGIILSGYPVFPWAGLPVPVPWRVPRSIALSHARWIHSWAMAPGVFWTEVPSGFGWLPEWRDRLPWTFSRTIWICLVSCGALAFCALKRWIPKQERFSLSLWLFAVCTAIPLAFWFFYSPLPRYAGSSLWASAGAAVALAMRCITTRFKRWSAVLSGAGLLLVFVVAMPWFVPFLVPPNDTPDGRYAIPEVETKTRVTDGGIAVNLPQGTDQGWLLPLPNTPYYRANLHWRERGRVRKGFYLDRSVIYADFHDSPAVPAGFSITGRLGVSLRPGGWLPIHEETGLRRMKARGRIIVFAERSTLCRMQMVPELLGCSGALNDRGKLRVFVNDEQHAVLDLTASQPCTTSFRLERDFNVITLEFIAVDAGPTSVAARGDDSSAGDACVAFSLVDLRAE